MAKHLWRTAILALFVVGALSRVQAPRPTCSTPGRQLLPDLPQRSSSASGAPSAALKPGLVRTQASPTARPALAVLSASTHPVALRALGLVVSSDPLFSPRLQSRAHSARAPPSPLV
jgi:hypothetical protein